MEQLESDPEFSDDQRQRLETLFAERQARFREFNQEMRARFETEQASLRNEIVGPSMRRVRWRSSTPPGVPVAGVDPRDERARALIGMSALS